VTGQNPASSWRWPRALIAAAGIGTAVLFPIVGLGAGLQMFGDGSLFSYSVAAEQAWLFHWRNISGRLFSYVYTYIPAEAYVALTQDAKGGIVIYGLLHFAAPLLGLIVTWATDRTAGRVIFSYACFSTACLCPFVFGVPTEMWMAHAVFWPALAICLSTPANVKGTLGRFAALLALVFTHGGGVVLSLAILFALALRGWRDRSFRVGLGVWAVAMAIWLMVRLTLRPDDYIAGVLLGHAFKFIDLANLAEPAFVLLVASFTGYALLSAILQRAAVPMPSLAAAFTSIIVLAVYWLWFDTALLAEARYDLRTVLLIGTPGFGLLAAVQATPAIRRFSVVQQVASAAETRAAPPLIAGAVFLVLLVHAVETAKFVVGWAHYKAAVRALAAGSNSDPALGDRLFVSSQRIGEKLNRLSWNSTTPYLSILLAPGLLPSRLVVDPTTRYFWLSCETATTSERTSMAIPIESRRLVRRYSCLHR
jgi:hypothetical protein